MSDDLTMRMIAYVQVSLDALWPIRDSLPQTWARLERLENYLIRRSNRGAFA